MNTLPSGLPHLPENAVYLGRGGRFKRLPNEAFFLGWCCEPEDTLGWGKRVGWLGGCDTMHYAAPKGSEIARLNGHEAAAPCPSECPMPDRVEVRDAHIDALEDGVAALKLRLSEAVRLGDALMESADQLGIQETYIDFDAKEDRVKAWEAFKAANL